MVERLASHTQHLGDCSHHLNRLQKCAYPDVDVLSGHEAPLQSS